MIIRFLRFLRCFPKNAAICPKARHSLNFLRHLVVFALAAAHAAEVEAQHRVPCRRQGSGNSRQERRLHVVAGTVGEDHDPLRQLDESDIKLATLKSSTSQKFVERFIPKAQLTTTDDYDAAEHGSYFERLAQQVSDGLNACGFVYCPGNAMASNPDWRQRT